MAQYSGLVNVPCKLNDALKLPVGFMKDKPFPTLPGCVKSIAPGLFPYAVPSKAEFSGKYTVGHPETHVTGATKLQLEYEHTVLG